MIRKILFYILLLLLAVSLFFNPNFKSIVAGVAILLFGLIMLEEGFRVFTKGPLKKILRSATNKLYKSIGIGAIVTALIQSSSLVSVVTISFISAGLIGLSGGIGLIFGANIGTTATAWLVAGFGLKINISALAMQMLVFGLIFSFQKRETLKGVGNILAGLGFFFLGIHYMKEGFDIFKEHIDLSQYAISGYFGVLIFTGLGVIITTILQSSSATLALVLTALAVGQIEYYNALALAIGSNIGTTITAILGSLTSNIAGKRLAGAHLVFNVITGLLAMVFLFQLSEFVDYLASIVGIANNDYTLKLAIFHTIFNVVGVVIMIPFIKRLEKALIKYFKETVDKDIDEPKYLNESVLSIPSATIIAIINESKYLFKNAIFEIVAHAFSLHRSDVISEEKLKAIVKRSTRNMNIDVKELYMKKVKTIYSEIIRYASYAQSSKELSSGQLEIITEIKVANRKMIEILADTQQISKNISLSLERDNEYLRKEYNRLRKKVSKVLRVIHLFRTEEETRKYVKILDELRTEANMNKLLDNKTIDYLIRNKLITIAMASSLFNDYTNVNNIVKKLIEVAELLYGEVDTLFENENNT